MMTGDQVREARNLLGWSSDRLGAQCDFSGAIILTFEKTGRMPTRSSWMQYPDPEVDRLSMIQSTLEAAGILFMDGEEPGVQLRKAEG